MASFEELIKSFEGLYNNRKFKPNRNDKTIRRWMVEVDDGDCISRHQEDNMTQAEVYDKYVGLGYEVVDIIDYDAMRLGHQMTY